METAWAGVLLPATIIFFTDLWWRKIYNIVTIPAILAGILYHSLYGAGIWFSLMGFIVMFAVGFIGFAANGWGGGDAKMLIMAGAWLGWQTALMVMLAGALIALFCFIVQRPVESVRGIRDQLIRVWLTVFWKVRGAWKDFNGLEQASITIPFGTCLAVGFWLVMWLNKT